jgi:hypothetical protein
MQVLACTPRNLRLLFPEKAAAVLTEDVVIAFILSNVTASLAYGGDVDSNLRMNGMEWSLRVDLLVKLLDVVLLVELSHFFDNIMRIELLRHGVDHCCQHLFCNHQEFTSTSCR